MKIKYLKIGIANIVGAFREVSKQKIDWQVILMAGVGCSISTGIITIFAVILDRVLP